MCACEPGFTCSKHRSGSWVDADQNVREWRDWKADEEERRNADAGRIDFLSPYGEAA